MQARILDVDGSLTGQPALRMALANGCARRVPLLDLARDLRLIGRECALEALRARLSADAERYGEASTVDFLGSGDFHHVTAVLLERIVVPVTVIHIDNHPDWVRWPRTFNCGGWINRALELPAVQRLITLGPCSNDLNWPEFKFANLPALASGRLEVYPWRHRPSRVLRDYRQGRSHRTQRGRVVWRNLAEVSWEPFIEALIDRIATEAVYITIDKDALASAEAVTNWDQGEMPLERVLHTIHRVIARRRLVGADVCGDYSPPAFASLARRMLSWMDRGAGPHVPRDAMERNDLTNARLLEGFGVNAISRRAKCAT